MSVRVAEAVRGVRLTFAAVDHEVLDFLCGGETGWEELCMRYDTGSGPSPRAR